MKRDKAKQSLIEMYGPFWPKNKKSFGQLRQEARGKYGVYLLYCGWQPVYVGQGKLTTRITGHKRSGTKIWDRFTWFALRDPSKCREIEAIFLRSLPFYLRLNNRQGAHLPVGSTKPEHEPPDPIAMPKMTPKKKK
jgi:hypothetical protein